LRLFIGVPISGRVQSALSAVLPPNLPGRVIPATKWHFTLRFLGKTEAALIPRLAESLGSAKLGKSFEIELSGLGAFPNPRRARVLWAGVSTGKPQLESLAQEVERAVQRAGFAAEERQFKPHLTLSRMQPPLNILELVDRGASVRATTLVDEVVLFHSRTDPGGAVYESLARFPLTRSRLQRAK